MLRSSTSFRVVSCIFVLALTCADSNRIMKALTQAMSLKSQNLATDIQEITAPMVTAVVEFGGSQIKVGVYTGDGFMKPDTSKGKKNKDGVGDGVIVVPGFNTKNKEQVTVTGRVEAAAKAIKGVLNNNTLIAAKIVFFVSAGHIGKYPIENGKEKLCNVDDMAYTPAKCLPKEVKLVASTLEQLLSLQKDTIEIEVDEGKLEALSVIASYNYANNYVAESAPKYPVMILLGGSSSSQIAYLDNETSTPSVSTFIMKDSKVAEYIALLAEKLGSLVGPTQKPINTVFFCSNFAFALVRPPVLDEEEWKSPESFVNTYFKEDLKIKADAEADAKTLSAKLQALYKPNQKVALTATELDISMGWDAKAKEYQKGKFTGYEDPNGKDHKIWTTLTLLYQIMVGKCQQSVPNTKMGRCEHSKCWYGGAKKCIPKVLVSGTAKFHIFKELVKDGKAIKAGASHGAAMQMTK